MNIIRFDVNISSTTLGAPNMAMCIGAKNSYMAFS